MEKCLINHGVISSYLMVFSLMYVAEVRLSIFTDKYYNEMSVIIKWNSLVQFHMIFVSSLLQ